MNAATNLLSTVGKIVRAPSTKTVLRCAVSELRPPTPMEIPIAIRDAVRMIKKPNWRNLTVREGWLNTLVTTEVICWFFVGEIIGKGTLIGYQV